MCTLSGPAWMISRLSQAEWSQSASAPVVKRSDFGAMMNYYRANYPKGVGETAAPPAPTPPINVPVLVIHGMKDTALNAAGHNGTWDHVTADTTVLMIPSAGHFVQHDAQDLVDRTVKDWLNERR